MTRATLTIDPAAVVAPVNRRTFGSFVEHLGRCVYTGIFEPDHPTADLHGYRGDVSSLVNELGVSTVRYPGGNFVSGYRWEDGVGPRETRPTRLDLAWHSTETNDFGLNEFVEWSRAHKVETMMAVNLGTRGIEAALGLLEYCNIPGGTALSEMRRKHGSKEPHNIKMWCLGNEMDGPWQIGHKTAEEYGRLAAETARAMRMIDKDLELIVCGSSSSDMPTFGEWERTVLDHTYEQVDMISAHAYYEEKDGDLVSFLASAVNMDYFIATVAGIADEVKAAKGGTKDIGISFDEWNVWYLSREESQPPEDEWPVAPRLLEDIYTAADAVLVGSLLISLLRNSDRVKSASLAQLVNVIAPIMTEPGGDAWRQTTFYPFSLTSTLACGDVLKVEIDSPKHATKKFGDVSSIDAVVTWEEDKDTGALFAVNRSIDEAVEVTVDVSALGDVTAATARLLHHEDPYARNTEEAPDTVTLAEFDVALADGKVNFTLPPISWVAVALN